MFAAQRHNHNVDTKHFKQISINTVHVFINCTKFDRYEIIKYSYSQSKLPATVLAISRNWEVCTGNFISNELKQVLSGVGVEDVRDFAHSLKHTMRLSLKTLFNTAVWV